MRTNLVLENFWRQLETAEEAVLLLDYDGTLAPFTIAREQAFPYPGVRELLNAIERDTHTRLVIISGRAIDDLEPLLGLARQPEIWGSHGWERLDAEGARTELKLSPDAKNGLKEAFSQLKEKGMDSFCEVKPVSLAIHWRGLSEQKAEELRQRVLGCWRPVAMKFGLAVHPFNGGLEMRCPGKDKGTALKAILEEIEPDIPIAFLGDDLTDEDGFIEIKGRGMGVLVNVERRETNADLHFTPPHDLIDFLSAWRDRAPQRHSEGEVPR
jgi:trehalose-phosphatase